MITLAPVFFVLFVVLVGWTAFWFIDQGVPVPGRMIAKLIVAIVALVILAAHFVPGLISI